ncbi:MAG: DUF4331 family protein, partial [Bacteroidota bacterium]
PFINNFLPNGGDMLRLNMAVPPTPRTDPNFSPLGLVQAAVLGLTDPAYNASTALQFIPNMDGFPNGRRLEDDVTLIELQTVSGVVLAAIGLWYDDFIPGTSTSPVTTDLLDVLTYRTGVNTNDTTFQASFPYLQKPWNGDGYCGGKVAKAGGGAAGVDLELSIVADKLTYDVFTNVTYTVTLTNAGTDPATGVSVSAGLPNGLVHTANTTDKGTYNLFFQRWDIPVLNSGESANLKLVLFTLVDNVDVTNYVQVIAQSEPDVDSAPNNGTPPTPNEDDEAVVKITPSFKPGDGSDQAAGKPAGNLGATFANVFPQPAGDHLTVEMKLENGGAADIFLFDSHAKVVLSEKNRAFHKGSNRFNLDISNLPAGLYFVHFVAPGESVVQRVIVMK